MAHPGPHEALVRVRRVVDVVEGEPIGFGAQVRLGHGQERPDPSIAPHGDPRQPGRTGSGCEPHQHGLGLVVEGVRGEGNLRVPELALDRPVSSSPRPRLEVGAVGRRGRHRRDGQAERLAQCTCRPTEQLAVGQSVVDEDTANADGPVDRGIDPGGGGEQDR